MKEKKNLKLKIKHCIKNIKLLLELSKRRDDNNNLMTKKRRRSNNNKKWINEMKLQIAT